MLQHYRYLFLVGMLISFGLSLLAQPKRTDAIWARTAPAGSITIDGKMNEPAWTKAESIYVQYGKSAGIPGSGYTAETGTVFDSTRAVVKFLVMGDSLYLAFTVKDSSIGGGIFGASDAIIFNIRDKSDPTKRPVPAGEYLWGWINESWMNPGDVTSVGAMPKIGPNGQYKKTEFETATTVKGITNSDGTNNNVITDPSKLDTSYTVEMKIFLKPRGYHVTDLNGDIIMFNVAFRDCDWFWPVQDWVTFSRTWIQGPWANTNEKNHLRIHVRPDVTTSSGAVPVLKPEVIIPDGKLVTSPTIDGKLDEAVWGKIAGIDIRFGSDSIRNSYPSTGPFRSGQTQPNVNGGKAVVTDPATANVKWFFREDTLFVGIDVKDKFIQYHSSFDRWDGVILTINGRGKKDENEIDHDLLVRKLTVLVDSVGKARLWDYFPYLRDSLQGARVALTLNEGSAVDTLGLDEDTGYQIEMAITLTKLGYPAGRGDGILFAGINILDGDSFVPASLSYGTRTWWFREFDGIDGPAFAYMDPTVVLTSVGNPKAIEMPTEFALLGNYPNPFNPSTNIHFTIPANGRVVLNVYDMLGRSISSVDLGERNVGEQSYKFNVSQLSTGVYFYQLRMQSASTGKETATPFGKMILVK